MAAKTLAPDATMPHPPMLKITVENAQALANYLATRPYQEVAMLIPLLTAAEPA